MLGCTCENKGGRGMYGQLGLGDTFDNSYNDFPSTVSSYNDFPSGYYDPSLTQYSVDPPYASNINSHPILTGAAASAFGAGIRVFESMFTPKPAYAQTTGPRGSSTVVWGNNGMPSSGLNLSLPGGGLSITTMALIGVGLIGAIAMFGHKGKG